MYKVEYLITINETGGLCTDIKSFNSQICSNPNISIVDKKITYKENEFEYEIEHYKDISENYIAYHVYFKSDRLNEKFSEMLRAFRIAAGKITNKIQTIWDDFGFDRCKSLYPKIYNVENSLRKLINKFMLINLGPQWYDKALPKKLITNVNPQKSNEFKIDNNILYNVDFIDLKYFLFIPYPLKEVNLLTEKTEQTELIDFIPKNNWDRYFSQIVDCETGQLEAKLDKLYQIRCKVAHNNALSLDEYNNGKKYCEFINPLIEKAITNIENIEVSDTENLKSNIVTDAFLSGSVFPHNSIDNFKAAEILMNNYSSLFSDLYPFTKSSYASAVRLGEAFARLIAPHIRTVENNSSKTGSKCDEKDEEKDEENKPPTGDDR